MPPEFEGDGTDEYRESDDLTIMESVFAGYNQHTNGQAMIHKQKNGTYSWDECDTNIFVCPKCKTAWQMPVSGGREFSFYEDFPTIGKIRKECPKCRRKS